ncbi:serine/threonine-protein phosphatase 6 regulatory ankyrin repeat subunit C-like isoform X2 [Panonychus citri]|uniref:serine/threonine-protein phosphatase 6 regulatory ankyrin repeat subunit C-like isoform X2 n=1 Tax=Panonychus citri TaxID=50023 RepID=UPI0023075C3B|nr:serine/threonine-protein phosphatase 6 regulatory ankyrin repeat subunit C-like isoform X2 [Panonychus citri]
MVGPKRRSQITSLILQACGSLNRTEMINYLLDQQLINPHIWKDRYEWSPLHKAVYKRDLQLVKLLISRGVDIYCREINGNTPLHIAIQSVRNPPSGLNDDHSKNQLIEIITLLLETDNNLKQQSTGPDERLVNLNNNFGKSALHYCVDLDPSPLTIQLIYMLINGGANVDLIDSKGRTPFFHLATEHKRSLVRSDNLPLSPFIAILTDSHCDQLNYNQINGKMSSLKNLCRQLIQNHFQSNNFNCLKGLLPNELINYLNRLLVK